MPSRFQKNVEALLTTDTRARFAPPPCSAMLCAELLALALCGVRRGGTGTPDRYRIFSLSAEVPTAQKPLKR